jgi:enoyl-CoA hydratase
MGDDDDMSTEAYDIFGPELIVEVEGPLRIITLNRPERLNAVNEKLHDSLANVWSMIRMDEEAKVAVLLGSGDAFCAGGDIDWFEQLSQDHDLRRRTLSQSSKIVHDLVGFPLPVVAGIQGAASGLGCSLAVLCDLVLMEEDAFYADPHVAVGLVAGDGGATVWPVLTSLLKAKEYIYTGKRLPADEAVHIGLANRVVPNGSAKDAAIELANQLAAIPDVAMQYTKQVMNMHLEAAISRSLGYALALESDTFLTDDHKRLVASFRNRDQSRNRQDG